MHDQMQPKVKLAGIEHRRVTFNERTAYLVSTSHDKSMVWTRTNDMAWHDMD